MGNIKMLGALAGDIIGSIYEFQNVKSTDFDLFTPWSTFTDDSVMTLAVAKWLTEDEEHTKYHLVECMQELGRKYPRAGYGGNFIRWLRQDDPQPYNSWGNGSGMRVSPVGLYAKSLEEALYLAEITASVSHNHPEGIKGAKAIAASVFLCNTGKSKEEIKDYAQTTFGYNLDRTISEIRPNYHFDVSCQGSVPEAIIAFLEGNSFEEVIRLAISLGGDSDTIGCMAGAIAACIYPIPEAITERCDRILTDNLRAIKDSFIEKIFEQKEEREPDENYYTNKLYTNNMKLSKIKEISPRTYWHNEATDFTPWLAEEDNLAQLSEVIYLDLELVSREERMDGGRADLLCKDTVTGNSVIIENQLEKTDPDHLGRILSYAAALKANTIIWIATEFDEQYRATIDWLNSVTDEEFNFFGIEIHLLQIGDSDYAPQFKVVAKPNDWQKQVKASSKHDAEELTETKKSQLEYWQAFSQYMAKHPSHLFKTQSPLPQHWMTIAIGRSGFHISLNVNSRENKNMIQLWINSTDPKETFDTMAKAHKDKSLSAISPDIDWQRLDNRKQCVISLSHPFAFTEKSTQDEQFKWFRDVTESFVKFFKPIVKNL